MLVLALALGLVLALAFALAGVGVGVSVVVVVGVVFLKKAIINFYWCKCLGAFSRPGWTYFVTLDLHGSSSYFLTIPNLGLRCTNIPAQYPMLVFSMAPSHKRTAQK